MLLNGSPARADSQRSSTFCLPTLAGSISLTTSSFCSGVARSARLNNKLAKPPLVYFHHCSQSPLLTLSVQKSIRAPSVSTKVGTPSILVMAKSQPRSHSSTVHLDRCLTIMRLSLIIALLDGYRLGRDLSVYGEHASLYCFCSF